MRLFAAFVPPTAVLDELESVVRSAEPGHHAGHHAAGRKGMFGRLGGAAEPANAAELTHTDQLFQLPAVRMHIPVATFGHLTRVDAELLTGALKESASRWAPPTLRLAGGTALEGPGDRCVWAKLDGDLDRLQVIVQGVPKLVQRLGLFVDRRQFRPWLAVGAITDTTTATYLEELVAALDRFDGMPWRQDSLSMMRGHPEAGPSEPFQELQRVPLTGP